MEETLPECEWCREHDCDHREPGSKPFGVWVGSERDGDGQPTTLHVSYAGGAHVGEGEAEYVRRALRAYADGPRCRFCGHAVFFTIPEGWLHVSTGEGRCPRPSLNNDEEDSMPCPQTGDTVLYEMPEDWHPELGIRTYPAMVLYPTNQYDRCLDLIVFTGIDAPYDARWVKEGEGPGTWRHRDQPTSRDPETRCTKWVGHNGPHEAGVRWTTFARCDKAAGGSSGGCSQLL